MFHGGLSTNEVHFTTNPVIGGQPGTPLLWVHQGSAGQEEGTIQARLLILLTNRRDSVGGGIESCPSGHLRLSR